MKKFSASSRKLRYGGVTAVLTAVIIAAVILVNVIFSALANRFLWYVDMTPELLYSVSDECYDLIGKIDANDDTDTPIEMVEKFRKENDKYNADAKKENADIAKIKQRISANTRVLILYSSIGMC